MTTHTGAGKLAGSAAASISSASMPPAEPPMTTIRCVATRLRCHIRKVRARFVRARHRLVLAADSSAVHVSPRDQIDFVLGQADAWLEGQRPTVESIDPPPTSGAARHVGARARLPVAGFLDRCQFQSAHARFPAQGTLVHGRDSLWISARTPVRTRSSSRVHVAQKAECVQPDCTRQGERHGRPGRQEGQDKESAAARDEAEEQEPKEVGQGAVQAIGRKHLGAINQPDERSTTA